MHAKEGAERRQAAYIRQLEARVLGLAGHGRLHVRGSEDAHVAGALSGRRWPSGGGVTDGRVALRYVCVYV